MAKYIFQGADASLPMAPMINYMERSGFEIHSVENVTEHYRLTLRGWHDNWMRHKDEIIGSYGERWYRIWHVFLAWAVTVAAQGTAACFQVVSNKNRNDFDRSIWVGKPSLAERMDFSSVAAKHPPTNGDDHDTRLTRDEHSQRLARSWTTCPSGSRCGEQDDRGGVDADSCSRSFWESALAGLHFAVGPAAPGAQRHVEECGARGREQALDHMRPARAGAPRLIQSWRYPMVLRGRPCPAPSLPTPRHIVLR
jgi:hypothetical protein